MTRESIVVTYHPEGREARKIEFVPLWSSEKWLRKEHVLDYDNQWRVVGTEHVDAVAVERVSPDRDD